MTSLMVDTSVLVKWFDTRDEDEVAPALALREAHARGELAIRVLDLAVYELANVLLRRRNWPASEVAAQLEDLLLVLGRPVAVDPQWTPHAWELAERHSLTAYDACWAAAALHLRVPLVSADRQLLDVGLAESATVAASRLSGQV